MFNVLLCIQQDLQGLHEDLTELNANISNSWPRKRKGAHLRISDFAQPIADPPLVQVVIVLPESHYTFNDLLAPSSRALSSIKMVAEIQRVLE